MVCSVFSTALQVLFRAQLVYYTCNPKSRPAGASRYRYTSLLPAPDRRLPLSIHHSRCRTPLCGLPHHRVSGRKLCVPAVAMGTSVDFFLTECSTSSASVLAFVRDSYLFISRRRNLLHVNLSAAIRKANLTTVKPHLLHIVGRQISYAISEVMQ